GASLARQYVREFLHRFRTCDACRRQPINRHTLPLKTLSTRLPISIVLVTVCFPISVHDRRVRKILSGLRKPSGLNTAFTRRIVCRSASEKTIPRYSFFS